MSVQVRKKQPILTAYRFDPSAGEIPDFVIENAPDTYVVKPTKVVRNRLTHGILFYDKYAENALTGWLIGPYSDGGYLFEDDLSEFEQVGFPEREYKTIFLNIDHLPPEAYSILEDLSEQGLPRRVRRFPEGFHIRLIPHIYYREFSARGLPEAFLELLSWASSYGYGAIEFDDDAAKHEDLPLYQEEYEDASSIE